MLKKIFSCFGDNYSQVSLTSFKSSRPAWFDTGPEVAKQCCASMQIISNVGDSYFNSFISLLTVYIKKKLAKIEKQIVTAKSFVIFMNSNLGTILRSFLCRNQSCLCLNLSSLPLLSPLEKVVFEKNMCLADTSVRGKKWQMALFQVGSLFIMTYFSNRWV